MLSIGEVIAGTGAPKRKSGNRYHRGSVFVPEPIGRPLDRNDRARIIFLAEALERRTKEPGKRNGALGYVGLTILRTLLLRFLGPKGLCCPSYETLRACTGLARASIAAGIERLEAAGILKVVRRIVRQAVDRISPITGEPERFVGTVQASNLYAFPVPAPSRVHGAGSIHYGSINNEVDGGVRKPAMVHNFVSEAALDAVRTIAPGWDRQFLLQKFNSWPGSRNAQDIDKAFIGWCTSFTKGKRPS
jgi:hypothetical protein